MTILDTHRKRRTRSLSPQKRTAPSSHIKGSPSIYGHSAGGTYKFPAAKQTDIHYGKMVIDEDSDEDDSGPAGHADPPPPNDDALGSDDPIYLFPEYNPAMSKHRTYRLTQAMRWIDTVIPRLVPVFLRVLRESKQLSDFSGVTPQSCGSHCSLKKVDVQCISFEGTILCHDLLCRV